MGVPAPSWVLAPLSKASPAGFFSRLSIRVLRTPVSLNGPDQPQMELLPAMSSP